MNEFQQKLWTENVCILMGTLGLYFVQCYILWQVPYRMWKDSNYRHKKQIWVRANTKRQGSSRREEILKNKTKHSLPGNENAMQTGRVHWDHVQSTERGEPHEPTFHPTVLPTRLLGCLMHSSESPGFSDWCFSCLVTIPSTGDLASADWQ